MWSFLEKIIGRKKTDEVSPFAKVEDPKPPMFEESFSVITQHKKSEG